MLPSFQYILYVYGPFLGSIGSLTSLDYMRFSCSVMTQGRALHINVTADFMLRDPGGWTGELILMSWFQTCRLLPTAGKHPLPHAQNKNCRALLNMPQH